jgi:hypothetical protein
MIPAECRLPGDAIEHVRFFRRLVLRPRYRIIGGEEDDQAPGEPDQE